MLSVRAGVYSALRMSHSYFFSIVPLCDSVSYPLVIIHMSCLVFFNCTAYKTIAYNVRRTFVTAMGDGAVLLLTGTLFRFACESSIRILLWNPILMCTLPVSVMFIPGSSFSVCVI